MVIGRQHQLLTLAAAGSQDPRDLALHVGELPLEGGDVRHLQLEGRELLLVGQVDVAVFELVVEAQVVDVFLVLQVQAKALQADGQFPAGPTIWTAGDRPIG